MITKYLTATDPASPSVTLAAAVIRLGGLAAFPTETVYGLGANALDPAAIGKIYAAKGRPADNPLIVHVADPAEAGEFCETCDLYHRLAEVFMPGPLTVILPRRTVGECVSPRGLLAPEVSAGLETAAIRCPSHPVARAIIRAAGVPVAAPSANLSERPSPTSAVHVRDDLDRRIEVIIDGGECEVGLESTVVKIEGGRLILLRPGAVSPENLREVFADLEIDPAAEGRFTPEKPQSPGMKYRHYSPQTRLVLLNGSRGRAFEYIAGEGGRNPNFAVIFCDEDIRAAVESGLINPDSKHISLGPAGDIQGQGRRLFAAFREADSLGADVIYARLPESGGVGLALRNRLLRAASEIFDLEC